MHMPSTMFQNVLDVLRNEKPVYIYFVQNRAFLGTSKEPIGEAEYIRVVSRTVSRLSKIC